MTSLSNRVYDIRNKRFLDTACFAILGTGKLIVSESGYYNHFVNVNVDDYIVQRYTGLKDLKGNPIYEGDIVKEHHYEDWGDEEGYEYIGVVRYKFYIDECTRIQFSGFVTFPNLNKNENYAGNPIKTSSIVIGNIIENSELI